MTDDNPGLRKVLDDIDALLPPGAPSSADELGMPDAMRWSPVEHTEHPTEAPPTEHVRRYRDLPPAQITGHHRLTAAALYGLANPYGIPDWILHAVAIEGAARAGADQLSAARDFIARYCTPAPADVRATMDRLIAWANQVTVTVTDALHIVNTITVTNPQRNQHNCNTPTDRAAAIIQARRHRNTGPSNPHGIDGRARRDQHPHRAPAPHARPGRPGATQVPATPRPSGQMFILDGDGRFVLVAEVRGGPAIVGVDLAGPAFARGGVVRGGPVPDGVWRDEAAAGVAQRDTSYDEAAGAG